MLKNFLDKFKFEYSFKSSSVLYKSGFFNNTLKFKPHLICTPECSNIITNDKNYLISKLDFYWIIWLKLLILSMYSQYILWGGYNAIT